MAPTSFFTTVPPLNTRRVGIESTSNRVAVAGFSSTLSLATVIAGYSAAISSSTGSIMRQGPHHGAQKSRTTGLSLPITSASKVASVTCLRVSLIGHSFRVDRALADRALPLIDVLQRLECCQGSAGCGRDDLLQRG